MESRVFSTETLMAGMDALKHQEVKVEKPDDVKAMQQELQDQNPQVQIPNFKPFARIVKTFPMNSSWYLLNTLLAWSKKFGTRPPFFILNTH